MRKALVVCRRDVAALAGAPLGWIVAALFLLLAGWFFYSDLVFFVVFGAANPSRGLWRFVFLDVRLVVLLLLPLLTMRALAEERRLGTLELAFSWPVRDGELLAGKFLGILAVYLALLAASAIGPVVLHALHSFPVGPVVAGYAGLVLLGVACIACGLAASAMTDNQVVAAMLAYGVLVFCWFVSWNEPAGGETLGPVLLQLSLFDHFYGFAEGAIDTRDVAWLLAFGALFLFVAHRALGARSWRGVA